MIDAHQHFWDLEQSFNYEWLNEAANEPIRRDFMPHDLKPHLDDAGIDGCVCVQTQHDLDETRWALKLSERNAWIAGVVGWVDLESKHCESQLVEFKRHPRFVGVRHLVQDEPDDFLTRPIVIKGLKTLERTNTPFDLLVLERQLHLVPSVARSCPELRLVIDHLAKPTIGRGDFDRWSAQLREAAKHPNVYCKLSGMVTEANWRSWTADEFRPYVHVALEAFTPRRCMFGSDWPVCNLAADYDQVKNSLVDAIGRISDSESDAIFGETATEFYGLGI